MTVEYPPLADGPAAPGLPVAAPGRLSPAVRGYWLSHAGLVMLAVTGLALAIRLYLFTRHGYLTGITEYDDGRGSRFPFSRSPRRGRACYCGPLCLTRPQGPVPRCPNRCVSRTSPASPTY